MLALNRCPVEDCSEIMVEWKEGEGEDALVGLGFKWCCSIHGPKRVGKVEVEVIEPVTTEGSYGVKEESHGDS